MSIVSVGGATGYLPVKPEEVLSTDIHERHLNDRPKDEKKLGE